MEIGLQNGIYYSRGQKPGNSCCVLFLGIDENAQPINVRNILLDLWNMYKDLQLGITREFKLLSNTRKVPSKGYSGNLSVLLGFGPAIFDLKGVQRPCPTYLEKKWLFRSPNGKGGGPILGEIGLDYADYVYQNQVANDPIVVQFIGDNEFVTNRAIVETWKVLRKINKEQETDTVYLRTFFPGFARPDSRGWLGFHEGVSNIRSQDRLKAITVNGNEVTSRDEWTISGTYLAFLRIVVNFDRWENTAVDEQERIVGRDKITGCPIAEVSNINGQNIIVHGCPVPGTMEITEDGNEPFREHPPYGIRWNPQMHVSDDVLKKSHIGRMYERPAYYGQGPEPDRIFRQGYEFLEPTSSPSGFRAGLNFISYQSSPIKLHNILTKGLGKANFGGPETTNGPEKDKLLSVIAAGLFLVPPLTTNELFPGERIFI